MSKQGSLEVQNLDLMTMKFGSGLKLKDFYGSNLSKLLSDKILTLYPKFNAEKFIEEVSSKVGGLELKDRIKFQAKVLFEVLDLDYPQAIKILLQILGPENPREDGMFKIYYYIGPIAVIVEEYGIDFPIESIYALEEITKRYTSEHALRPFLIKYPELVLPKVREWAKSPNFHLRRLASEGIRTRLPWSPALIDFKKDPSFILEILEILKEDEIRFVQRSVANNLNDILKDNPEIFYDTIHRWKTSNHPSTNWIIFHATRNLRKKGLI